MTGKDLSSGEKYSTRLKSLERRKANSTNKPPSTMQHVRSIIVFVKAVSVFGCDAFWHYSLKLRMVLRLISAAVFRSLFASST